MAKALRTTHLSRAFYSSEAVDPEMQETEDAEPIDALVHESPALDVIRTKIPTEPANCIQELNSFLESSPNHSDALQLLAVAHEELDQLDDAVQFLERAVSVSSVEFIRDRRVYCQLAQVLRFGAHSPTSQNPDTNFLRLETLVS